jgi:hypothetical protein
MSQIASTTTITPTSVLARALGAGVSAGGTQSANTIRKTLGGGGRLGGRPPRDTGGTGPPGGPPGGGPDDNPDAGGGGNPGNPGGGGNPIQPLGNPDDRLTDKLIGREPEIFDGDRTKVEGFMTEWNVYRALNDRTRVMATPLERTMLFSPSSVDPMLETGSMTKSEWSADTSALEGAKQTNSYGIRSFMTLQSYSKIL